MAANNYSEAVNPMSRSPDPTYPVTMPDEKFIYTYPNQEADDHANIVENGLYLQDDNFENGFYHEGLTDFSADDFSFWDTTPSIWTTPSMENYNAAPPPDQATFFAANSTQLPHAYYGPVSPPRTQTSPPTHYGQFSSSSKPPLSADNPMPHSYYIQTHPSTAYGTSYVPTSSAGFAPSQLPNYVPCSPVTPSLNEYASCTAPPPSYHNSDTPLTMPPSHHSFTAPPPPHSIFSESHLPTQSSHPSHTAPPPPYPTYPHSSFTALPSYPPSYSSYTVPPALYPYPHLPLTIPSSCPTCQKPFSPHYYSPYLPVTVDLSFPLIPPIYCAHY